MNSKDEWDVEFFAHLPRIPPNSNYHFARVLLYAWPMNLTPFTISTIFTNYITSFSPKKNWDPSFPPQQNSPQVATENSSSTLRLYASESWRLSKIPSVPMSTTSPSSTSEATKMSRFPNSVQQGFTKNGVFLTMVMSIFFLSKRLINVEMVSELLVVHLSQNEAYLFHDSDWSQKKSYD